MFSEHRCVNMLKSECYLELYMACIFLNENTLFARFAHKQDSQLNSSVLITVWRVVIEKSVA